LGKDGEDTAIVQMVIELAHTLGMEDIAEGVEGWGQAALLEEMGCDFGQGYHFSEPLPADEVPMFLTEERVLGPRGSLRRRYMEAGDPPD
jgi:EAL domain-containing protein (putative c-di-GMP-specific phosphodiesterase class I)